ncbi:MAG: zf-HC2 domain-containing protein [Lachnospiraceae bacterium]|nr:zf-HC2 domain-containing protein [Lachnospiraceae bacterium]
MDKNNYDECDIVQDLLPLYYDDACNSASKQLVEEHLKSCAKCQKTYKELQDTTIDTMIQKESTGVLERHVKKEKNAAYKAGVIIALLLMVPIIITFLVSAGSGGGFGAFWVLAASMLLVGALTVVPLTSSHNKLVRSIIIGIAALLLIMFFVDRMNGGGEFILWSVPTVFGLSVVFFPIVIRQLKLPVILADKKALVTMLWDTAWLYLTIFEVCNHSGDVEGMRGGLLTASVMMSGVWLVFLIIRYLKVNGWMKAGFALIITSIWIAFSNDVCALFVENKRQLTIASANFSDWAGTTCVNANVFVLTLIIGGIISGILLIIGFGKMLKEK